MAVGADNETLAEALDAHLQGEPRAGTSTGRRTGSPFGKLAFVFSGQGSQWAGMGRRLLNDEPAFALEVERWAAEMKKISEPTRAGERSRSRAMLGIARTRRL